MAVDKILGWIIWIGFALFLLRKADRYLWLIRRGDVWRKPDIKTFSDLMTSPQIDEGSFVVSFWPQIIFGAILLWFTWDMTWGRLLILPIGYFGFLFIYGPCVQIYVKIITKKHGPADIRFPHDL